MRDPLRLSPTPPGPESPAGPAGPDDPAGPDASGGHPAETWFRPSVDWPGSFSAAARYRTEGGEPFYPVSPFGRPEPAQRAAMLHLVDEIGFHLVCPEPRCRRAKRCRDPDEAQLPLCFWLHRGTCRFVLACIGGRAENGDLPDDDAARAGRTGRVRSADTLLGRLRRDGWPIEQLARTREDGADEWSWETHPEACELVDAFRRPKGPKPKGPAP